MSSFLNFRSYDLPDLQELVKEIWIHSEKWRMQEGRIEFSIKKSNGEDEWLHVSMAPYRVEKFVRSWYQRGGLNNQERIDS